MFSVIITIYNKERYILRALESVLNQTFADFEVIVVDDGSVDGSLEKVLDIKDDRLIVKHKQNQGVCIAKNYAVSLSKREYVAFLDADDYWNENYLAEIVDLIDKYPEQDAYVTGYARVFPNRRDVVLYDSKYSSGRLLRYFERRIEGWGVHTSSTVIARSAFYKFGGFPVLVG